MATGNLLDHMFVLYGSGMSQGNGHIHDDLPTLLMGGGAGLIKSGLHIRYPRNTPMANLYVTLLDKFGVHVWKALETAPGASRFPARA